MAFDWLKMTGGTAASVILIVVAIYLPLALVFSRMSQMAMSQPRPATRAKYTARTGVAVFLSASLLFVAPCLFCLVAINSGGAVGGWALTIWILSAVSVLVSLYLLVEFSALSAMQAEEMRLHKGD